MARDKAIEMIVDARNKTIHPVEMLGWTWLLVFVQQISDEDFKKYMTATAKICAQ